MSEDEIHDEIHEKLEILRKRYEDYSKFIAPDDQPPLLWQMAMLAQAGWTILPRVDDPDIDKSFREQYVEMRELQLTNDHFALVGGYEFSVMALPRTQQYHMLRLKPPSVPYYCHEVMPPQLDLIANEVEVFKRWRQVLGLRDITGQLRYVWESHIMICEGSLADELVKERNL